MGQREDRIFLTGMLKSGKPFSHVRFGDGEFEAMAYGKGANWDKQPYSPKMQKELIEAWASLSKHDNVYLAQRCPKKLIPLINGNIKFTRDKYIDAGALLTHEIAPELANFYRALIADPRKKIYVAPPILKPAMALLRCSAYVEVKKIDGYSERDSVFERAFKEYEPDCIYLCSASVVGKVLMAALIEAYESVTCIDLGSALDPVYIGKTRSHQPPKEVAIMFFSQIVGSRSFR